jgi:hypothetical protein
MTETSNEILELKKEKLRLLEEKEKLMYGLPHRYAYRHYKWSREFFESRNKQIYLTSANQVGKSSIQIRKMIEWAGNTELWPQLWATRPLQFWYLYPTKDVATAEFKTKWQEFMPRNEYKDHPTFGWKDYYDSRKISFVEFNSGVLIYFKTYAQNLIDLQSGTVFYMGLDEELPVELLPELESRVSGCDGYLSAVFTPTLAQEWWRKVMEPKGTSDEIRPEAKKIHVSLYDCINYEDGTPSPWTEERVKARDARCVNEAERQRRIYGRFVKSEGLKYFGFERENCMCAPHDIPPGWVVYSGVDIGSGGTDKKGHPSAIVFVACSPDHRTGRVFRAWRGDGIPTTASQVLIHYRQMKQDLRPAMQTYDYACRDFFSIATSYGENFVPAEKSHEIGTQTINTVFKHGMLKMFNNDAEIEKLATELENVPSDRAKTDCKDDLCDALRYCIARIPWDYSVIAENMEKIEKKNLKKRKPPKPLREVDLRRDFVLGLDENRGSGDIEDEINAWNDLY